jgi:hypothetical protein
VIDMNDRGNDQGDLASVSVDAIKEAINRAYAFCEEQQAALDEGFISEAQWFDNHKRYFTAHYLASDNPRGQSGHGGDEARYRYTQEMILDAIDGDGTFIDVGCANGYLMEKLNDWSLERGYRLEFYGLDISEELIELARRRLPQWKDRFFVGNALYWEPARKYRYVCVRELEYVPQGKRRAFFLHLVRNFVEEGDRLILGPRTERLADPGIAQETASWGYPPTGSCSKPHQEHEELIRRVHWYEISADGHFEGGDLAVAPQR